MSLDRKDAAILESLKDLFHSMGRLLSALGIRDPQTEAILAATGSAAELAREPAAAQAEAAPQRRDEGAGEPGQTAEPAAVRLLDGSEVTAEVRTERSKGGRKRWFVELGGRKVLVTRVRKGIWRERGRTAASFEGYTPKPADVDLMARLARLGTGRQPPTFQELVDASEDHFSRGQVLGRMRVLTDAGFVRKTDGDRYLLTAEALAVPGVAIPAPEPVPDKVAGKAAPESTPAGKPAPRRTRAARATARKSPAKPAGRD